MRRLMLFGMIVLSACAPSAGAIQTAIAQTAAPKATLTKAPSGTATRTPAPRPSASAGTGNVYTLEVGVCFKNTGISGDPKTQGCQLLKSQRVTMAENQSADINVDASIPGTYVYCALFKADRTLVSSYVNPSADATNVKCGPRAGQLPTPTRTLTPTKGPTATKKPTATPSSTATARKPLQVERRDFVTYPEKYTGQYVVVPGIVFNINSNTELQLYFGGDRESPVYVVAAEPYDDIYVDDDVVVFGNAAGSNCGTNSFGARICQALITDACVTHHVYTSPNVKKDKSGERPTPDYSLSTCP